MGPGARQAGGAVEQLMAVVEREIEPAREGAAAVDEAAYHLFHRTDAVGAGRLRAPGDELAEIGQPLAIAFVEHGRRRNAADRILQPDIEIIGGEGQVAQRRDRPGIDDHAQGERLARFLTDVGIGGGNAAHARQVRLGQGEGTILLDIGQDARHRPAIVGDRALGRQGDALARIGDGHDARRLRREQFADIGCAHRMGIDCTKTDILDRRPFDAGIPCVECADRRIIRHAGCATQRQALEEGRVGQDRHDQFAIGFLDVEAAGGVGQLDIAIARRIGQRVEDVTTFLLAIFRADRDLDRPAGQVEQCSGEVGGGDMHALLAVPLHRHFEIVDHFLGQLASAIDVDRHAAARPCVGIGTDRIGGAAVAIEVVDVGDDLQALGQIVEIGEAGHRLILFREAILIIGVELPAAAQVHGGAQHRAEIVALGRDGAGAGGKGGGAQQEAEILEAIAGPVGRRVEHGLRHEGIVDQHGRAVAAGHQHARLNRIEAVGAGEGAQRAVGPHRRCFHPPLGHDVGIGDFGEDIDAVIDIEIDTSGKGYAFRWRGQQPPFGAVPAIGRRIIGAERTVGLDHAIGLRPDHEDAAGPDIGRVVERREDILRSRQIGVAVARHPLDRAQAGIVARREAARAGIDRPFLHIAAIDHEIATAVGEIMAEGAVDDHLLVVAPFRNAGLGIEQDALELLLVDEVDDPRDRVRAIDGGGAARQHIDPLDERRRDHRQVDLCRARHPGHRPAAIDQDEGAIRPQIAQIDRREARIGGVRGGGAAETGQTDRRILLQGILDVDDAVIFQRFRCQHLKRTGRRQCRRGDAAAGDDDVGGGGAILLRCRRCGQHRDDSRTAKPRQAQAAAALMAGTVNLHGQTPPI